MAQFVGNKNYNLLRSVARQAAYFAANQAVSYGKRRVRDFVTGPGNRRKRRRNRNPAPPRPRFRNPFSYSGPRSRGSYRKRALYGRHKKKLIKFRPPPKRRPSFGPTMCRKNATFQQLTCSENQASYTNFVVGDADDINGLFQYNYQIGMNDANTLSRLEQIDPQNYNTTKIYVRCFSRKLSFRNNYNLAVKITCYWVVPKCDASVTPSAAVAQGLDDLAGSDAGWESQPYFYPEHSMVFRKRFKIVKRKTVELNPGDSFTTHVYGGTGYFDKDWYDNHLDVLDVSRKWYRCCMVRLQGVVGHAVAGSTSGGYMDGKLDCVVEESKIWNNISSTQIARWGESTAGLSTALEAIEPLEPEIIADPEADPP